jgi:hypothetical protein
MRIHGQLTFQRFRSSWRLGLDKFLTFVFVSVVNGLSSRQIWLSQLPATRNEWNEPTRRVSFIGRVRERASLAPKMSAGSLIPIQLTPLSVIAGQFESGQRPLSAQTSSVCDERSLQLASKWRCSAPLVPQLVNLLSLLATVTLRETIEIHCRLYVNPIYRSR